MYHSPAASLETILSTVVLALQYHFKHFQGRFSGYSKFHYKARISVKFKGTRLQILEAKNKTSLLWSRNTMENDTFEELTTIFIFAKYHPNKGAIQILFLITLVLMPSSSDKRKSLIASSKHINVWLKKDLFP